MGNYLDNMYGFSQTDLKNYLGKNVVDSLVEWTQKGDMALTKQRLIKMIDSVYGTNILKNSSFRKDLLLQMKETQIYEIRDEYLKGNEKRETNLQNIVKYISSKPWGNNNLSKKLLELWGVTENIFEKKEDDSVVENDINAEEQFYELLDYQYYIKQRVLFNLNSGNLQERMLVHMPTGTGKTKTSMHIIVNYINFTLQKKGLIIWVAHTSELLQQAYDTFVNVWNHLGDGSIKAYKLWDKRVIEKTDQPLDGIVFCGLQKLMSISENDSKLFERLKIDCRLLVFDEAHKASANITQKVIESILRMPEGYENRALLGLTATPGRTTEDSYDNNLLTNMFGNKLISIDSDVLNQINMGKLRALNTDAENNIIKYFQKRRILAKMNSERLDYKKEFSEHDLKILSSELKDIGFNDKEYTEKQLQVLAQNKNRNFAIMKKIRQLYSEGVPTIVFACSVEHAQMLSAMLTLEEIPNSLVVGSMNPVDRKKAINDFKNRDNDVNIIINYEVLTTGFDSKNIRCVFITRPTKSVVLYSQMLGRGLRGPLMGGNEECLLIDIEDNLKSFDNETAFSYFNDYWIR